MTTKIGRLLRTGTVLGVMALGLAACGPADFSGTAPNAPANESQVQKSSQSLPSPADAGGGAGAPGPILISGDQAGTDCPPTGAIQTQTGGTNAKGSAQSASGVGEGQVGDPEGQVTAQSGTVGVPVTPGAPTGGTTTRPTPEELAKRLEQVNLGPSIPASAGVGVPEPPGPGTETTVGQGSGPVPVPAEQGQTGQAGGVAVAPGLSSGVAPTGCK